MMRNSDFINRDVFKYSEKLNEHAEEVAELMELTIQYVYSILYVLDKLDKDSREYDESYEYAREEIHHLFSKGGVIDSKSIASDLRIIEAFGNGQIGQSEALEELL